VSPQSIYNWEGGKARPRGDQLAKLASLRAWASARRRRVWKPAPAPAAKGAKQSAKTAGEGQEAQGGARTQGPEEGRKGKGKGGEEIARNARPVPDPTGGGGPDSVRRARHRAESLRPGGAW